MLIRLSQANKFKTLLNMGCWYCEDHILNPIYTGARETDSKWCCKEKKK